MPEEVVPKWTKADVRAVEDRLLALGLHRTAEVREQASFSAPVGRVGGGGKG